MNTSLHPFRRVRAAAVLLLLSGVAGCSLGRTLTGLGSDLGNGAVAGARGQLANDSTQAAIARLTGAATSGLASGIASNVRPAIDTTLSGAFGQARAFLNTTQDSLALFLSGPLNTSLQGLIRGNVQTLGTSLDAQLQPLIAQAGVGLREQLALTLAQADTDARQVLLPLVGAAVDTVSARLATNANGPLRQAIDSIVSSAVRSGVDAAEQSSRPLFNRLTGALAGIAGVMVLGALLWMRADRQKSQRAMFAMAEAIRKTEDEQVREAIKDRIKANARRHGIDGYLHTFLEKKQLLRGSEQPDRIAVGKVVREEEPVVAGDDLRP